MNIKNFLKYMRACRPDECAPTQRAGFYIWNIAALVLAPAAICISTLLLAIGMFEIDLFIGFFRNPLIFFLNYIPIFLLELLLFFVLGKQYLAYLLTSFFFIFSALGDFFKLKFRYEPFLFSDFHMIDAALGVAKDYDLTPNTRIVIAIAVMILGTVFLAFAAKGRFAGHTRCIGAMVVVVIATAITKPLYFSNTVYEQFAEPRTREYLILDAQRTAARGFVYPFIYSVGNEIALAAPPDGYDEMLMKSKLETYENSAIDEDKAVNVIIFQLESFCDLTRCGFQGLDVSLYDAYRELESEGLAGNLVSNVFGGSTVVTEHNVLTGEYDFRSPSKDCQSYVRYFKQQGYTAVGSHPYPENFYNRVNVNKRLGFDDYRFFNNYFSQYMDKMGEAYFSDELVISAAVDQCLEIAQSGGNVFSFNVTFQGHGPYPSDSNVYGTEYWHSPDGNTADDNVVNFYLGGVNNTISQLCHMADTLRESDIPVVVVMYGDHKPFLDYGRNLYEVAGVEFNASTLNGFFNYYSTPYLIWENQAAEAIAGSIAGDGPDISPCYLMNLLFDCMGWKGNQFLQYMDNMMEKIPVVTTHGVFMENGSYTKELSPEGRKAFDEFCCMQYYYRSSFNKSK